MELKGIYLVIDPKNDWEMLLAKIGAALQGGLGAIQIWNHWNDMLSRDQKLSFISDVKQIASPFNVPVIMNEDWEIALAARVDGVHFDTKPDNYKQVKASLNGKIIGFTVSNDLQHIRWAHEQRVTYISFCAMFPTATVETCEIVTKEVVREARAITDMPIFLSGGIKPDNLKELSTLSFEGVAVVSGILSVNDPNIAVKEYANELKKLTRAK